MDDNELFNSVCKLKFQNSLGLL